MTTLGVVFPSAHTGGGVERISYELLRHFAHRLPTEFIGTDLQTAAGDPPVAFRRVSQLGRASSLRPLAFRLRAARKLEEHRPDILISLGANCPPGDIYWVQSVHRSWLNTNSRI